MSLLLDMKTLGISLDYDNYGALLASFVVRPTLVDQIRGKQMQDEELVKKVNKIMNGKIGENYSISQDGMLTMKGRACVLDVEDLRQLIMEEAHCSAYAICHNGFPLDLDDHKNKWSRHQSFLYGCDRSPDMHVFKLGIEILNLKQID